MKRPLDEIDAVTDEIVGVYKSVSSLDPRPYLHPAHAAALEREIAIPLRTHVSESIARIGLLQRQLDGQDVETGDWDDVMEATQVNENAPSIAHVLDSELWTHVADVCFTVRGDLRRAERALRQALDVAHEDRLAVCESAQRKLRRALLAVLAAVGRARDRTFPVMADLTSEIEAAAAVRRMYAKFRRSLPTCDPADPSSVRRALRFAAVSLAVVVGRDDFSDARAQDRATVLHLQARVLRWARDGASDAAGAQLYQDIVTAADLLRTINLRQELAAHDQEMLAEARAALESRAEPAAALDAALPPLRAVAGRDDALDELVNRVLAEPVTRDAIAALRQALAPPSPSRRATTEDSSWNLGEEPLA